MSMNMVWMVLLALSAILLAIVLLRAKGAVHALGYIALNIVIAAFLLYFINLLEGYSHFRIPINPTTVLTVGILGIPGLMLLVAVRLLII
jgi:inhibitor of the pro-sigma K processing machinery